MTGHEPALGEPGTPSTSVVVCAYTLDRWDLLSAAVRAAALQAHRPWEVLLVVDHNDALAVRAREDLAGIGVSVLSNRYGRGLSGARNTGVEQASGEIVAFLDDDAVPEPGWLATLVAPFDDPEVVATGGVARPAWSEGRPSWFPREFDWVVGCSYEGQAPGVADIRNPLGCNMAFRRAALAAVDGFREDVGRVGGRPLGCEETELCIRLRQATPAARIVSVPGAVVDHFVTPDRHRFTYFRRRCYAEGISKAVVTEAVGAGDGLSSERTYVTRALPRGLVKGLRSSVDDRTLDGAARSAAIVAGLGFTVAGYVRGKVARA
ncbi:MAG: glycosyltransferase [Acidimicrobiales bacterium]|nr:glycosyltransferase [Acidimicrobiales bacterium]